MGMMKQEYEHRVLAEADRIADKLYNADISDLTDEQYRKVFEQAVTIIEEQNQAETETLGEFWKERKMECEYNE